MGRSRKIQVTLPGTEYDAVLRIARGTHKSMAGVVREAITKYSLAPEAARTKREALQQLFELAPTQVPRSYAEWEREYSALKTKRRARRR